MPTYKLTAVNTTGALKIETDSVRVDFLIPDDVSVNYDVTNSVINIGTGAIQFQLTLSNSRDSSGNPFADFAAIKTFIEGIFFLNSGGSDALVYRALLSQSSTDAPVATVNENTLGEVPTYSFNSDGDYSINSAGAVFSVGGKTLVFLSIGKQTTSFFTYGQISASEIRLYTARLDGTSVNDVLLNGGSIMILVYP